MANKLLHTKQKKSEVSNHFYASNTGHDTDINIVSMASKGNYLTAKAGGQWHSVKLQPPQEVDNGNFIDLTVPGGAPIEVFTIVQSGVDFDEGDVNILTDADGIVNSGASLL